MRTASATTRPRPFRVSTSTFATSISRTSPPRACIIWNDFFDLEQDKKERPDRPLPSGQVTLRRAAWLGAGLMVLGVLFAFLAGWVNVWRGEATSPLRPVVFAVLLVGAIFLYDG